MMAGEQPTPPVVSSVLEAALAYASVGWRVVPIKPSEKRPPMRSWQHAATTNSQTITNWFTGLYKTHGVGIATGPESAVWVLDVDTHGADGLAALAELEAEHEPLPATVCALTGSGGRHYFFRYPPDVKIVTTKNIGDGIDVRGEGGQVLAYPTIHPNGTLYEWITAPGALEVADAPDWLLDLVTLKDEPAPTAAPTSKPRQATFDPSNPDSIAEWIRTTHRWEEVLALDGWTVDSVKGADTYYTRPGKKTGTSGVLHNNGTGPFVVFTTSITALMQEAARSKKGDGWAYSLFGYIAATRYNGDRKACASDYRTALNDEAARRVTTKTVEQAKTALDQDESADDDDWSEIDLGEIATLLLAGELTRTVPSIMRVEDHPALFYPGLINGIFGEPGGGKSWLGYAAAAEVISDGGHVLVIDWEDYPQGVAERLLAFGLEPAALSQLLHYRNPASALSQGIDRICTTLTAYTLVIIDSTGEAMAAGGIDSNSDTEVALWFKIVKRLCRMQGAPGVLVIDHIPKDPENGAKTFAIGSQRKKAAITGASYRIDTIIEPARGKDGKLKMTTAKDRFGTRPKNSIAAVIDFASINGGDNVALTFKPSEAQAAAERGEAFHPTVLMERVSRYLEGVPSANQRAILKEVSGKQSGLRSAIEVLLEEGWISAVTMGATTLYASSRPYREGDLPSTLDEPEEPF